MKYECTNFSWRIFCHFAATMVNFYVIVVNSQTATVYRELISCDSDQVYNTLSKFVGHNDHTVQATLANGDVVIGNAQSFLDPTILPFGFILEEKSIVGNGVIIGPNFTRPNSRLRAVGKDICFVSYKDPLLTQIFG
jgi:hypothetical protein